MSFCPKIRLKQQPAFNIQKLCPTKVQVSMRSKREPLDNKESGLTRAFFDWTPKAKCNNMLAAVKQNRVKLVNIIKIKVNLCWHVDKLTQKLDKNKTE